MNSFGFFIPINSVKPFAKNYSQDFIKSLNYFLWFGSAPPAIILGIQSGCSPSRLHIFCSTKRASDVHDFVIAAQDGHEHSPPSCFLCSMDFIHSVLSVL